MTRVLVIGLLALMLLMPPGLRASADVGRLHADIAYWVRTPVQTGDVIATLCQHQTEEWTAEIKAVAYRFDDGTIRNDFSSLDYASSDAWVRAGEHEVRESGPDRDYGVFSAAGYHDPATGDGEATIAMAFWGATPTCSAWIEGGASLDLGVLAPSSTYHLNDYRFPATASVHVGAQVVSGAGAHYAYEHPTSGFLIALLNPSFGHGRVIDPDGGVRTSVGDWVRIAEPTEGTWTYEVLFSVLEPSLFILELPIQDA